MNALSIEVQKTARYYTLGDVSSRKLLYVLHGYGQLAKFFISKFNELQSEYYIVAPEGLHRFYLQGYNGKVGASWMTKESRESDIIDYINFLNTLHAKISESNSFDEINILGFSQGVATAFRWLDKSNFEIKNFLICSGMIPPDMKLESDDSFFTNIKWTYITGDKDEFKDELEVQNLIKSFKDKQLMLNEIVFNGSHTLDIKSVVKALNS